MAEYWRVKPDLWAHARRNKWDEDTRTLALYLLTCPHRTTEGLFWLPKPYMWADLAWDPARLDRSFDRLVTEDFIAYDDAAEVLLIVKAMKYQRPDNENQQKAAVKALLALPQNRLWPRFLSVTREHAEPFADYLEQALPKGFGEALPQTLTPKASPIARVSPAPAPAPAPLPGAIAPSSSGDDPADAGAAEAAATREPEPAPPAAPDRLPVPEMSGDVPPAALTAGDIVNAWNEICPPVLPEVRDLTDDRRDKLRNRLVKPGRDATWWRDYFARIRASPFLCGEGPGRNGCRPFRATFDWAISGERNVAKVLEGNYDGEVIRNGIARGRTGPHAAARPGEFTAGLYQRG